MKNNKQKEFIPIKESSVEELIEVLQKVQDKKAIVRLDPCEECDPWPFRSLFVDGDFVLLSLDKAP